MPIPKLTDGRLYLTVSEGEFKMTKKSIVDVLEAIKRGEFSELAPLDDSRRVRKTASAVSSGPGSEAKNR